MAGETSIWKKEITFRRRSKPVEAQPATPPAERATSIWKKEIRFRRKRKREPAYIVVPPPGPAPPAPAAQPHPPQLDPSVLPPVTPAASPTTPTAPPSEPRPAPAPVAAEAATAAAPAPETREQPTAPPRRHPQVKRARRERKTDRSLRKRVVGLKIGASQLAAAYVVNKGEPRVVRMARAPLARGIVVGGELREPEQLAAALKAFFRKNKLPQTCVRLGIANNRIGVRTFEITGIEDERQLANAIRFRAQETLPIPLEEAVLDYRILDERLEADGTRVRRVLLVVAHRELVERYVAACKKAGLKLIGIDLEAFALLRALRDPASPPAEDAALVCVTIGHDRSTLAVSNGSVCEFTRVLAWGGSALDAAVAGVLDLTPAAAEPIKHALSLTEHGEGAGLDAARADEARRAMAAELQVFARELVASLRFYQEQPGSLGIAEILVTGGAAACGGLAEELERLIGLPVRVADPLARTKLPRKLRNLSHPLGSLAVAVGLGIED